MLGAPAWAQCDPQWVVHGISSSPVTTVNSLLIRDPDGAGPLPPKVLAGGDNFGLSSVASWDGVVWTPLGALRNRVTALATLSDGTLIAGGVVNLFETNPIRNVASWDGQAWKQMGDGLPGSVFELAALPGGGAVAAGHFPQYIARWDGQAWGSMGAGFADGPPNALVVLPNGDVVAAGSFTRSGNVPLARIARWNGSAWLPLGTGLNGSVESACLDRDGKLIVSGNFSLAGGVATQSVAMWNGQAWSAMGEGLPAVATALCLLPDGSIVATGAFGPAEGTSTNFLRRWTGSSWMPMAGGFNGPVYSMCVDPRGDLIAGGYFVLVNGREFRNVARRTEHPEPGVAAISASQSVHQSKALRLTASPVNAWLASYQWYRNGVPLTDALGGASLGGGSVSGSNGRFQSTSLTGGFVATLSLWGIQPSDAGEFTIAFTNSCGTSISGPIQVEVTPPCPGDVNNDNIVDDADFSLFCADYDIMLCYAPKMPWGCPSSFNGDFLVDDTDFMLLVSGYLAMVCP